MHLALGASAAWRSFVAVRELRLLRRLARVLRDEANTLADDAPACSPDTLVSIVIPARNEEGNIEACVRAALAQDHARLEVIVIDDGSTDRTAEILARIDDPRLRVLDGGTAPLPAGWLGKPWACHRAAGAARGDYLLFVDADVRLGRRAVSAAVGRAEGLALGVLTGFGTELAVSLAEKVLHPYVFFRSAAETDWESVNDPACLTKGRGNGRFLLLRRDAYQQLGGHESVREFVAEDEALGVRAKRLGVRYRFFFLRGLYRCRMYRSARELWTGWRRLMFQALIFKLPQQRSPPARKVLRNLLLASGHVLLVSIAPYLVAALALARVVPAWLGALAALPILLRQMGRLLFDRRSGFDPVTGALTHWFANLLFLALLVDGVRTGLTGASRWKGRALGS